MADEGEDGTAEDRPPALDQLVPSAFGLTFALDERLPGAACPGVVGRVLEGRRASSGSIVTAGRSASGAGASAAAPRRSRSLGRVRSALVRARSGRAGGGGSRARARPGRAAAGVAVPRQRPVVGRWPVGAAVAVPGVADGRASGGRAGVRAADDRCRSGSRRRSIAPSWLGSRCSTATRVELAVGHGVGVQATLAPGRLDRGLRLQTAAMPAEEVPRTDAPGADDFDAIRRSASRSPPRCRRWT